MMMRTLLLILAGAVPSAAQQAAPDSARVYDLHEVEALPRPQNVAEFATVLQHAYPPHLRQSGVGGTVQVAFVVGTDGQPRDVRVVSTSDSSFSAPTAQAVSLLRFSPAQLQGRPVPVRVEQPVVWRTEAAPAAAAPAPGPPDSIRVYAVEEADVRPIPRNFGDFHAALRELYPRELRDARPQAAVLVRFVIDPSGRVQYPHVHRSSDARFDGVSVEAVRRLLFQPARRQGAPVWVRMEVPVAWGEVRPVSSADSDGTYDLRDVDAPPRLRDVREFRRRLEELYPVTLRTAGESGIVQVRFRIEADGTTSNHIIAHSTNEKFNDVTLRAVRAVTFRPAVLDGRPVPVWVDLPIHWTIALEFEEPLFSIPDQPMFDAPPSRPDRRP